MSGLALGKWIAWSGGDRPVDPQEMVTVIYRCGNITRQMAGGLCWGWIYIYADCDILYYKPEGNGATQ